MSVPTRFGRRRAMLMAGALIATTAPAHVLGGRAAAVSAAQDDKQLEKERHKQQKAQEEEAEKQEKARKKDEKSKRKQDEDRQKQEKKEAKEREKEQEKRAKQQKKEEDNRRKEEEKRRKHGLPTPTPSPEPTPRAGPTPAPSPAPTPTATANLEPRERLARAVELLQQGQAPQARAELAQLLTDQPGSREGRALAQTIDTDPQALFGAESFAYRVGPRDTLITLAIAFLGDSYKFYGLARYNHIAVPASLRPGDTIQIPGRPRTPVVRRPPREEERGPAPTPTPAPTPAAPVQPRADPARAQTLRRAGLEQMSAGSIDRAVGLLEAATRADPGNAAIAADLARARRVQATVHGR